MMTDLLVLMILNFRHLQLVLKTTSGVKFTCAALRTFPHQHAVETNQETIYIYIKSQKQDAMNWVRSKPCPTQNRYLQKGLPWCPPPQIS